MDKKLTYEKMNDPDKPENARGATELYQRFLNNGESISRYLYEGFEDPRFVGIVCKDGDRVVGAVSGRPGIEFTVDHPELAEKIAAKWGMDGLFTGDMVAVHPDYRGLGIGAEISILFHDELKKQGCKYVIVEAWIRSIEQDTPSHWTVKYLGMNEIVAVDRRFYKNLADYGLTCPECGADCHCGAIVSVVTLW